MSDAFDSDRALEAAAHEKAKARNDAKLQTIGRQIVSTLYLLIRNVKIHSPDNAIFIKPINLLSESINAVVANERQMTLQASGTSVFLNGTMLKFEFAALENVSYLTKEFQLRDMGGFEARRPVNTQEIRDLLHLFSGEFRGIAPETGAAGHELPSLRLARYEVVREAIEKLQQAAEVDQQIDRKKYLMTVYARTVFYMRKYLEFSARGVPLPPLAKAARLVQDLVDLCYEQRVHLLGLTTSRGEPEDYLPFHSVNCALISIVFGAELGLDRRQQHDLGMAALFSQVGLADVPEEFLTRKGGLTRTERAVVDLYPLRSTRRILATRGLDKTTMARVVATYESKIDYAIPRKDESGEVQLVMPKLNLGVYGKIISIAECYDALTSRRPFREAYGPEVALALMCGEMKYKFDPVFLRIFMKVMAIQPVKILDKRESNLRIG